MYYQFGVIPDIPANGGLEWSFLVDAPGTIHRIAFRVVSSTVDALDDLQWLRQSTVRIAVRNILLTTEPRPLATIRHLRWANYIEPCHRLALRVNSHWPEAGPKDVVTLEISVKLRLAERQ